MGDRNDHLFRVPFKDRLDHLDEMEKQENKLRLEKLAAEAQAYHAEAYRQMPADLRQRAAEWGVSALMELVWMNGWDCGYRQSNRDRDTRNTSGTGSGE
jgi:hypothetical protein